MNTKLTAALGCLLMAALPMGMAHMDDDAARQHLGVAQSTWTPVNPGGLLGTASVIDSDGPAGWYTGSVGALVQVDNSIPINQQGALSVVCDMFNDGDDAPEEVVPDDPTTFADCMDLISPITPAFALGAAQALCDLEILGPGDTGIGTAPTFYVEDEADIDGFVTAANDPYVANHVGGAGGFLGTNPDVDPNVDGDWDDGGSGAVCHTSADAGDADPTTGPDQSGYYANDNFNTGGCEDLGSAYAYDMVLSGNVWITPSCDLKHDLSTTGALTTFEGCVGGAVLTQDLLALDDCASAFAACVGLGGVCASPVGTATECGGDHAADLGGDGGLGGNGVAYPNNSAGVTGDYESVDTTGAFKEDCDDYGSAATFVWNAVVVNTGSAPGLFTNPVTSVATHGWITEA